MCVINYCVIIYHQYVCVHVLSDGNVNRYDNGSPAIPMPECLLRIQVYA